MAEWILTTLTSDGKHRSYTARTAEFLVKVHLNPLSVRLSINARDEEDDGNVIDIQISRKMITGRVKTFINEYITTANNRYKLDIPKFDISELLINLKI